MDRRRVKFSMLGGGVLLSMAFLIFVGINGSGGAKYYLSIDEFLNHPERQQEGFRINGKVSAGTIVRLPTGQDVRFEMTDGERMLPVAYHGIIPDTFVDGADVVVEGTLAADGAFKAHTLLAKCPSKYEAAEDGADLEAAVLD